MHFRAPAPHCSELTSRSLTLLSFGIGITKPVKSGLGGLVERNAEKMGKKSDKKTDQGLSATVSSRTLVFFHGPFPHLSLRFFFVAFSPVQQRGTVVIDSSPNSLDFLSSMRERDRGRRMRNLFSWTRRQNQTTRRRRRMPASEIGRGGAVSFVYLFAPPVP